MSRSTKHYPKSRYLGCRSEKDDKRIWHKRLRTAERIVLCSGGEEFPHVRDVSDPWDMGKDGKPGRYFGGSINPAFLRK